MYTNVSDAFDRAGHGHKQLCIGLAPSRCDVIKREDSRWPSSAVPIPRERSSPSSGPQGQEYRNEAASARYFSEPRGSYAYVAVENLRTVSLDLLRPRSEISDVRLKAESWQIFLNIVREITHRTYTHIGKIMSGHIRIPTKRKTSLAQSIRIVRNYCSGNESRSPCK